MFQIDYERMFNMSKKIISLLVCISILCSALSFALAAPACDAGSGNACGSCTNTSRRCGRNRCDDRCPSSDQAPCATPDCAVGIYPTKAPCPIQPDCPTATEAPVTTALPEETATAAPTATVPTTAVPTMRPTAEPTATVRPTSAPSGSVSNGSLADQVFDQVNAYRAQNGKAALTRNAELDRAAAIRANEIAEVFSHTRPDGSSCFTVSDLAFGENIAKGYATADKVMAAWISSDGHRANILRDSFGSIGIAAVNVNGVMCWVQLFGK